MILQALAEHYEVLVRQGKLDRPGWANAKISYALSINDRGELEQVDITKIQPPQGSKKQILIPRPISLPVARRRNDLQVIANFLWDHSDYLLGVDENGVSDHSLERFENSKALHSQLLKPLDSPAAKAILMFFAHWDPATAMEHPVLQEHWDEIVSGVNLVFRYNGSFIHKDPLIGQAWQAYYDAGDNEPNMVCLVTGKKGPIAVTHPPMRGLPGFASTGVALVSFDKPAFCSYGHEKSLNAPVSKYAAFAYTAALSYMIADQKHVSRLGDTTVLFWAKNGQSSYQDLLFGALFGEVPSYTPGEISDMVRSLMRGEAVQYDDALLDPNMEFFILGVSPNSGRMSVRFFLRNTFGDFLRNIQAHQDRLEIIRPSNDTFDSIPLWRLLGATVNQNSRDKSPSPLLAGEVLRAILTNTRYPASLLNGVTLRIRAEHQIDRTRAAISKAYYMKLAEINRHENPDIPKEVLTVSLNSESTCVPYNLGRLFSVLETIQEKANPGINTTIKDKYFNSASATPSRVFPTLVNLSQKHLRKLDKGSQVFYAKQLTELLGKLSETYPDRMNLPQQGSFQLGYYHQTQDRYQKKEDTKNV